MYMYSMLLIFVSSTHALGLDGFTLHSQSPAEAYSQDRPKIPPQSYQVFFGHPLCLVPSVFVNMYRWTQSMSTLHSTCPKHRKHSRQSKQLTCSTPSNSQLHTVLSVFQIKTTHLSDHSFNFYQTLVHTPTSLA